MGACTSKQDQRIVVRIFKNGLGQSILQLSVLVILVFTLCEQHYFDSKQVQLNEIQMDINYNMMRPYIKFQIGEKPTLYPTNMIFYYYLSNMGKIPAIEIVHFSSMTPNSEYPSDSIMIKGLNDVIKQRHTCIEQNVLIPPTYTEALESNPVDFPTYGFKKEIDDNLNQGNYFLHILVHYKDNCGGFHKIKISAKIVRLLYTNEVRTYLYKYEEETKCPYEEHARSLMDRLFNVINFKEE